VFEGLRVIALVPVLDEEAKIARVLERIPLDVVDETLVIDDGSKDRSAVVSLQHGATVLPLGRTFGVGAALRAGYCYAMDHGFDVAVVMAGNNKDAPEETVRLLNPIAHDHADFVQGSRWLARDRNLGAMPTYRKVATTLHPLLFSCIARRRVTDSTNGFRAVRVDALRDPRLRLDASWLDRYDLEPYLYLAMIRLGYRCTEVPVTKVYPPKSVGQTKMRPVLDWWSILRPLVHEGLHLHRRPSLSRSRRTRHGASASGTALDAQRAHWQVRAIVEDQEPPFSY
jgi:dolichol-phosphate mannosyltransferase